MENQSQPIYIPLNRFGSPGPDPSLNRTSTQPISNPLAHMHPSCCSRPNLSSFYFPTPPGLLSAPPACIFILFLGYLFSMHFISIVYYFGASHIFIFASCILNYPLHFIFLCHYILFILLFTIIHISILCINFRM